MSDAAFERDLRSVLTSMAPTEAPISVYDKVRALSTVVGGRRHVDWFGWFAAAATGAVAIVVIAVIGVVLFAGSRPRDSIGRGAGGNLAFEWQTEVMQMAASAVVIEAGGKTFVVPANAVVTSDPATPTYRTLEMTWRDQGVEMRLNIYLDADGETWRVNHIRTYDGQPNGEWIAYEAPQITAALDEVFEGDVTLSGRGQRGTGTLRFDDLRLDAFPAGTGISWQPGCAMLGPTQQRGDEPKPQPVGFIDLSSFGVQSGMEARAFGARMTAAGICHDFRLESNNFSAVWCTAPTGKVDDWTFGSEGQLIVFVEAPPGVDPQAQDLVGC